MYMFKGAKSRTSHQKADLLGVFWSGCVQILRPSAGL